MWWKSVHACAGLCACVFVRARECLLCSEKMWDGAETVSCGFVGFALLLGEASLSENYLHKKTALERLKENVRKISGEKAKRRTACKRYQREIKKREVDRGLPFIPLKIRSLLLRWFGEVSIEPGDSGKTQWRAWMTQWMQERLPAPLDSIRPPIKSTCCGCVFNQDQVITDVSRMSKLVRSVSLVASICAVLANSGKTNRQ